MKLQNLFIGALFAMSLTATKAYADEINLIPQAVQVNRGHGSFILSTKTNICIKGEDALQVANFFANKVNASTGFTLKINKSTTKNGILFVIDPKFNNGISSTANPDCQKEAYHLQVTETGVVLTAQNSDGLFRGMQTLLQLLPPQVEKADGAKGVAAWNIPSVDINDAPRFGYRGVMLDPCRHWLPASDVKRIIDVLALYKFNRVHWHLTDDQGWRVQSDRYPELNKKGSFRVEGDGSTYGGFYTKDEIRDVVAYAKERHIEIIPELEMPGHELAAIATIPELSCRGEEITPRIIWGVEDVVMCPGKELMFEFLQNEIDEFCELFPYKYFHIGGDESPREEWQNCPNCQQRMKDLGYTKEAQLQDYIIERMGKYLKSKGKTFIGWDEILEGGNLEPSAIVMSWRGEEGGVEAAKKNHYVLMTPGSHGLYFDHFQGDPITEPNAIGGYSTLEKVYSYDPVPEALKTEGKDHFVLGVQANNWSEYIHNPEILEYRMFPRALALSEIAWSPVEKKDFKDFQHRVDGDAALRLDAHNINYHIPVPEQVGAQCNNIAFLDSYTLELTTTRPEKIVYTTDTSDPSITSKEYTGPLTFNSSTVVKARCVLPNGELGGIRTIKIMKDRWHKPLPSSPGHHNLGGINNTRQGVRLRVAYGNYEFSGNDIPSNAWTIDSIAPSLESVRTVENVHKSIRNTKNYAATAECFIDIPDDGIYEFYTLNSALWLDGEMIVDNRSVKIPRISFEGKQIALKAGRHSLKTLYVLGIYSGWPTYWEAAHVQYRKQGETEFKTITPEQCTVLPHFPARSQFTPVCASSCLKSKDFKNAHQCKNLAFCKNAKVPESMQDKCLKNGHPKHKEVISCKKAKCKKNECRKGVCKKEKCNKTNCAQK